MSLWRREAIERFPELRRQIADVEGIYLFWALLRHELFKPAYEEDPPDMATAARVHDYADWSLRQRSPGVRKAVADEFYGSLADDPRTRRDMPRWLSQEDFNAISDAWGYMAPENYAALRRDFAINRVRLEKKRRSESQKQVPG